MDNILTDLWYGNIRPCETFCRDDPAMPELSDLLHQSRSRLMAGLTAEQQDLLEEYDTCQINIEGESEAQAFLCGFRLGARLLLAAMHTQTGE